MKPKKSLKQKKPKGKKLVQKKKSIKSKQQQKIKKSPKQKILSIGAEAVLSLEKNKEDQIVVTKNRLVKSY